MARGLSPLQKDILRVLDHGALTTQEILMQVDVDICPQSRAQVGDNSLRRALMRLWDRGLVMRTAKTIYQDGGRYSHWWALPTERFIDRHSPSNPPYLVSDRCPLHATYGTVVYGRWEPPKRTYGNTIAAITGMPVRPPN
jgi:predicted transcriptional regulator